jgi:hypothetical protein
MISTALRKLDPSLARYIITDFLDSLSFKEGILKV